MVWEPVVILTVNSTTIDSLELNLGDSIARSFCTILSQDGTKIIPSWVSRKILKHAHSHVCLKRFSSPNLRQSSSATHAIRNGFIDIQNRAHLLRFTLVLTQIRVSAQKGFKQCTNRCILVCQFRYNLDIESLRGEDGKWGSSLW